MLSFLSFFMGWFSEFFDLLLIGLGAALVLASFSMPLLALAGPAGMALGGVAGIASKIARYVGVALILVGGVRLYVARAIVEHDAARDAAFATELAAARLSAATDATAAIVKQSAERAARTVQTNSVKSVILNAPSHPCASPALAAAFDELRRRAGSGGGHPAP